MGLPIQKLGMMSAEPGTGFAMTGKARAARNCDTRYHFHYLYILPSCHLICSVALNQQQLTLSNYTYRPTNSVRGKTTHFCYEITFYYLLSFSSFTSLYPRFSNTNLPYSTMANRSTAMIGMISAGVIAVGYGVATYASNNSVGETIPANKAALRTQGAQGEAVKSGMTKEDAMSKIKSVPVKGGDKGLTSLEKDG